MDWIQLPDSVALPTLKQGVIAGVFKIKGVYPQPIARAEKLQRVFSNDLSLEDGMQGSMPCPQCGLMFL